jgi:hypothetical protein
MRIDDDAAPGRIPLFERPAKLSSLTLVNTWLNNYFDSGGSVEAATFWKLISPWAENLKLEGMMLGSPADYRGIMHLAPYLKRLSFRRLFSDEWDESEPKFSHFHLLSCQYPKLEKLECYPSKRY